MPNEDNKILKYNQGEKSMKVPFVIYVDLECLLKKHTHVNIILKNHQQKKKTMYIPSVTHCLQIVHLTQPSCAQPKTNLIVTTAKIAWKGFVRI